VTLKLIDTRAEHFLSLFNTGTVSTNIFLRRLHNFALDMNWLPAPIIVRRQWPKIEFREKRGVTLGEHQRILANEENPEWRAFYSLLWHLGGSQSDVASLRAEDVDWRTRVVSFSSALPNVGSPVFEPRVQVLITCSIIAIERGLCIATGIGIVCRSLTNA
jgi:integrase